LSDDFKKFVSEPQPPPQEVEIPEERKAKVKSHSVKRTTAPAIALLAYGFFHRGLVPGLCFGAVSRRHR
jgi:hypothetical protein